MGRSNVTIDLNRVIGWLRQGPKSRAKTIKMICDAKMHSEGIKCDPKLARDNTLDISTFAASSVQRFVNSLDKNSDRSDLKVLKVIHATASDRAGEKCVVESPDSSYAPLH